MDFNERQIEIVHMIQRLEKVNVNDLCRRFRTSAVTIRKDLDELQQRGILVRTHGGAMLAEKVVTAMGIEERLSHGTLLKQAIARKALEMIHDADTVALDAGSTTVEIARLLHNTDLRVVTNSLVIAQLLCARDSGGVIMLGGTWRKESECFMGPLTINTLERLNIDVAFVGSSGITVEGGFNSQNTIESQTKECILSRATRRFIVADSSKYGRRAFCTFCPINGVTGLIVDEGLTDEARQTLIAHGLEIITAHLPAKRKK